ncbi:hypothetical protein GJ688_13315 [Heliobacillus mobilis]|uniref:Staygreen protein domain-containing protein n=1 Tax=Heliobacterium mobile TaxID=28064 RepID=A0A6I3SLX2_HELMO|nr:staygreen family protein [Heliobacterium mobile]MTV49953.1 hypothetical protein [Heliobacterium mobile]
MAGLNPEKLFVDYRSGVTATSPVIPRRYTLTHSDETGDLFLTIAPEYAYDKITALRDEALAEWRIMDDRFILYVYLYVNGGLDKGTSARRNYIFRRELPLVLQSIRYGDRPFFAMHPELDQAPVIVYFDSTHPEYRRLENWGTPANYSLFRKTSKITS